MQFIKVICRRRLSFSLTATILHVFKHDINKLKEISFHLSNMQFSTKDQDNDHHNESDCAEICERGPRTHFAKGVNWYPFQGYFYSLKHTEMKVKTKAKDEVYARVNEKETN